MSDQGGSRAREADRLAKSHPYAVLWYLPELRTFDSHIKQHALDTVGRELAFAALERPTMQECREAIGEPDNAARKRWVDTAAAARVISTSD